MQIDTTDRNSGTIGVNAATEHPTVPAQLLVATQPARTRFAVPI